MQEERGLEARMDRWMRERCQLCSSVCPVAISLCGYMVDGRKHHWSADGEMSSQGEKVVSFRRSNGRMAICTLHQPS